MRYIKQLKKSLILSFEKKPLKFQLIFGVLIISLILALIAGAIFKIFFNNGNALVSVFFGFLISYFLFVDTLLYLFRNIKKLNTIKINLTILRDLLIVLVFFIIIYRFIKINYILAAAGITVVPVSLSLLWIFFPLNLNSEN